MNIENEIPIIGEKRGHCIYCKTPFSAFNHPSGGLFWGPKCHCARPVLCGDLQMLRDRLEGDLIEKPDQVAASSKALAVNILRMILDEIESKGIYIDHFESEDEK